METPSAGPAEVQPRPAPLLPAVLLGPASFLWLWVLPLAVLGLLNLHGYWLVGSEMNAAQREHALWLGAAGLANLLAGAVAYGFARFGRGRVADTSHALWGLPGLLGQITYLWLAVAWLGSGLLPASVTAWIYPETRFLYNQFAFCMLPAFHGILRLAAARSGASPAALGRTFAASLGAAVGGPVLLYVAFQGLAMAGSRHETIWTPTLIATLIIVTGVLMFFGVLRGLLVALSRVQAWHATGERWAVVLFALALPFAGLMLNRKIAFPVDLQATEVYALTAANALVLLFAVWLGETRPRLSWHLLCATLPFTLYFFVIFLPFIPLSVLAVIVMGFGLLVLTPTLLLGLHLHLLGKAWRQAADRGARRRLWAGGGLAFLLLPAFFTGRALADKAALNAALAHLHEPTVPAGDISFGSGLANLRRAVDSHRNQKRGLYYPLLSDYYAWLVFDNLVLPDAKLNEIENTFFGPRRAGDALDPFRKDRGQPDRGSAAGRHRVRRGNPPPQTVVAEQQRIRAVPLDGHTSVVTAAWTLRNTGPVAAEYETGLNLPAGVFVRGFRLQVGESLVPGRIFERKTAQWVYAMIRDTERRDPGILSYRSPTELELRVFPVRADKPVTVEMDLLVPVKLSTEQLAETGPAPAALLARIGGLLGPVGARLASGERVIAGLEGRRLPAVEREPYLHVIVDRSQEHGFTGELAAAWPALRAKFPEARWVRVTAANYEVVTLDAALVPLAQAPRVDARQLDRLLPLAGGLALDLALAHAMRQHHDRDLAGPGADGGIPPRPVFVILSRHAEARALELPLAGAWADAVPGLELCELGADGSFVTHRQENHAAPLLRSSGSVRPFVANHPVRFAAGEAGQGVEYWDPAAGRWAELAVGSADAGDPAWPGAVELQLRQQDHDRNPGDSGVTTRDLVARSRRSGVLVSCASYIVVENQAQWRMLETGERQKLGQNQALEFVETPAPPAWWVAAGFAGWLLVRRRRGVSGRGRG